MPPKFRFASHSIRPVTMGRELLRISFRSIHGIITILYEKPPKHYRRSSSLSARALFSPRQAAHVDECHFPENRRPVIITNAFAASFSLCLIVSSTSLFPRFTCRSISEVHYVVDVRRKAFRSPRSQLPAALFFSSGDHLTISRPQHRATTVGAVY